MAISILTERLRSRPTATFLVRADRLTFRLDLRRRREQWEIQRIVDGPELPADEAAATDWITPLLRGRRAAPDLHLLTTDCGTHFTELPDAPRADQLDEVLGLEAEQITGVSVADFVLAHRTLRAPGNAPVYQLTWIEWNRALELRGMARRRGYHLRSVGHPGGFRLSSAPQLEDWPGVSLRLPDEGESQPPTAWHGPEAATDVRAAAGGRDSPPGVLDLHDPTERRLWAEALVAALDRRSLTFPRQPLITVPELPVSGGKQIAIGLAAGAVAALLVFAHYTVKQETTAELREELAQLRAPREELAQLERERTQLRRELNDLRRQGSNTDQAAALFTRGPFLTAILRGLSEAADERSVVARITAEGGVQRIEGLTLHPEAPYALQAHLTSRPPLDSWDIHLEGRNALLVDENGGPWSFVLRAGPPPPPPATSSRPVRRR